MFCTKNQVLLHRRRLSWPFRIHQNLRNCPTKLIFVFFMFVIVILMNGPVAKFTAPYLTSNVLMLLWLTVRVKLLEEKF